MSVKCPKFEKGLPASPVRGREGLAALATKYHASSFLKDHNTLGVKGINSYKLDFIFIKP